MNRSESNEMRFVRENFIEDENPDGLGDLVTPMKEVNTMDEDQGDKLPSSAEETEHMLKLELLNLERVITDKRHRRGMDELRLKNELSENEHRLDIEKLNAKQEALKVQHEEAEIVRQNETHMENLAEERHKEVVKLEMEVKRMSLEKVKLQNEAFNDQSRNYEVETAEKHHERKTAKLRAKIDGDKNIRAHELELETQRMHHSQELSKLAEDLEDEWQKKERNIYDRFNKEMQEKRKNQQQEMTQLLNSIATLNIVTGERRKFIKIRKKARMRDLFRKVRQEVLNGVNADFTLVFQATNLDENASGDIESHGIQSLNTIGVMLRMRGGRCSKLRSLAIVMIVS